MFADPTTLIANGPITGFGAGTSVNLNRLPVAGTYAVSGLGSLDEPYSFSIKNGVPADNNQPTRFRTVWARSKNVPLTSGILYNSQPKDAILQCGVDFTYVPAFFTDVDLYNALCTQAAFLVSSGNLAKLMRGEM